MRILIAEDDPIFATTIQILVEELNYEIVGIAENGQEAIRLFAATKPDLVLLDIGLKGNLDGIQVAEKISQSDFCVPFIFITAFKSDEIFSRAKHLKPAAFLLKPFDELTLQRNIELALFQTQNPSLSFQKWTEDVWLRDFLFIKINNNLKKIATRDIFYIETNGKELFLVTENEVLEPKIPLKTLSEKLLPQLFVQIHRQFIVNIEKIQEIDLKNDTLQIKGQKLPISKRLKQDLLEKLYTIK